LRVLLCDHRGARPFVGGFVEVTRRRKSLTMYLVPKSEEAEEVEKRARLMKS
jgi:hypothetical protein